MKNQCNGWADGWINEAGKEGKSEGGTTGFRIYRKASGLILLGFFV